MMDDFSALLAAIIAHPAEDVPRLACADWLDENEGSVPRPQCGTMKRRPCAWCKGTGRRGSGAGVGPSLSWCRWCQGRGTKVPVTVAHCSGCNSTGRVSNGYALRAEFIRVGCELARIPVIRNGLGESVTSHDAKRHRRLTARHAELLAVGRGLGWFDVPGLSNPGAGLSGIYERDGWTGIWWSLSDAVWGSDRIEGTISRGFVAAISAPAAALTDDLLRAVFACQPVTRVTAADREPWKPHVNGNSFGWYRNGGVGSRGVHPQSNLPTQWFDLLKGYRECERGNNKYYHTPEAALQALFGAIVRHGRTLAGLAPEPTRESVLG